MLSVSERISQVPPNFSRGGTTTATHRLQALPTYAKSHKTHDKINLSQTRTHFLRANHHLTASPRLEEYTGSTPTARPPLPPLPPRHRGHWLRPWLRRQRRGAAGGRLCTSPHLLPHVVSAFLGPGGWAQGLAADVVLSPRFSRRGAGCSAKRRGR